MLLARSTPALACLVVLACPAWAQQATLGEPAAEAEGEDEGAVCESADTSAQRDGKVRARVVLKPLGAAGGPGPERPTKLQKKIVFRVNGAVA